MGKIFKGFKQVSSKQFDAYKETDNLEGYLWFVRTAIISDGENTNNTSNDEYDIYFGKKHYGHFCEGELPAIKDAIDVLRSDLGFAPGSFEFGSGVNTIQGAFDSIASMIASLTQATADNSSEIEAIKDSIEKIDHEAYIEGDKKVLESALQEITKLAEGAVAENTAAIAILNGDEQTEGSVSKKIAEEITKVVYGAPEDFDTLKEIADYIASDKTGAAELSNRISALENIDHEAYKEYVENNFVKKDGFNEFTTELEEKLDSIENGSQVNKIESIKVNGVDAEIDENKIASVKIDSEDIELGFSLTSDGKEKYGETTKLSSVLQGIQNSITQASSGAYLGVVAGNGVSVSDVIGNQQIISAKISSSEGNLITVSSDGLFAAMYYDGDDVDPSDSYTDYYKELIQKGGTISLQDNVYLSDAVILQNTNSIVNLNDKKIEGGLFTESNGSIAKGDSDSYAFWVKEGATLELNGKGTVESQAAKYSMAVWAQGGTVIINDGIYVNNGEGSDLIYASNGGKVYIYGGEFKPCEKQNGVDGTSEKYSALNIKDKDRGISEIKVYGGKFYGFNPADNTSEGPGTNFVAEGYKSVEVETGVWEVIPE